ncbi:hypothetical protein ABZ729_06955 [Streptomyces sp. NPDC006678]|uniref:hypothetical protein n=1 Tax=Streptomyces sp. NPDC006678 TaxID=3157185 RepID=UPI0033D584D0
MPWDEWEQLKAEAADKDTARMRLNQLPADPGSSSGGGGGRSDLVVRQDDLGAVGHDAFDLHSRLGKQADIAGAGMNKAGAGSTMQAAASLKSRSFATGSVMESIVELWTTRTKTLLQACAHISNHLDFTKKMHSQDDRIIAASLRNRDGSAVPVSRINEYFT